MVVTGLKPKAAVGRFKGADEDHGCFDPSRLPARQPTHHIRPVQRRAVAFKPVYASSAAGSIRHTKDSMGCHIISNSQS